MRQYLPAKSYDMLLKQFIALQSVLNSKEQEILRIRKLLDAANHTIALADNSAIEAERATNAILSELVVELENRVLHLQTQLAKAQM